MAVFQIRQGTGGYHWVLKASNGEIVCWSESYSTIDNAKQSILWTRTNAPVAPLQQ